MELKIARRPHSAFRIILAGFAAVILAGALLLMLPLSSKSGSVTSFEHALFTSTSAVCVTGLIVKDTALYWSGFGQAVILVLIQIGGLGVVTVAAFIETTAGKKLSLLERNLLEDSLSAFQVGGMVRMTRFIFRTAILTELAGAVAMMPVFCRGYGMQGIWMSVFHSVSAFCNAGFDLMGTHSGAFSSLTAYSGRFGIVLPVCLLIILGGIGFLTWHDMITYKTDFRKYRMQSKVILVTTAILILIPAVLYYLFEFSASPLKDRLALSLFQAVTPRTAGFNTADLTKMTGAGITMMIVLMLIGGSPGSTAGGMKTTTVTVLLANALAVFQRKKNAELFRRRIEDSTIKTASAILMLYIALTLIGGGVISLAEGLPMGTCLFETASAAGTVGLTLGITSGLGTLSHAILIALMFFGRVGGLTLMYAAISARRSDEAGRRPVEKINVG